MLILMCIVSLIAANDPQEKEISLKTEQIALLDSIEDVAREAGITVTFEPDVLAISCELPDVMFSAEEVPARVLLDNLLAGGSLVGESVTPFHIHVKKALAMAAQTRQSTQAVVVRVPVVDASHESQELTSARAMTTRPEPWTVRLNVPEIQIPQGVQKTRVQTPLEPKFAAPRGKLEMEFHRR
jgi:hypothetical protein